MPKKIKKIDEQKTLDAHLNGELYAASLQSVNKKNGAIKSARFPKPCKEQ